MASETSVPSISWQQVVPGKEIAESSAFVWYRGSLRTPGTHQRVPVCYKTDRWSYMQTTDDLMHEARVLKKLKGLKGVPRLFGMTQAPPAALVLSLCPGRPLKELQRPVSARTYLAAIRETCVLLGSVHRRGIVHGNINAFNILVVTRRRREDVSVSLVGFHRAELTRARAKRQADTDSLVSLLHDLADKLSESSWLYKHRDKLMLQRKVDLTGLVKVLCSVLHDDPAACSECKALRPWNDLLFLTS